MMLITKSCRFLRSVNTFKCSLSSAKHFSTLPSYDVDININGTSLNNYIKSLQKEFEVLNRDNINNHRLVELQPVMQILNERTTLVNNIHNLKDFLEEKDDIRILAEEERSTYEKQLKDLDKKLLLSLVPTNKEDLCDSIVLEVQSGVGGQEAMLFAKEVFDMYTKFIEYKGWQLDVTDYAKTETGGIRLASALVSGPSVFRYFKYEAGVHRVQRIPSTEKGGRTHTSTISVITMPQPSDIEININRNDLKIETKTSSGAGGQHVNKTESAVRMVHLPTGIAVECQVDRSQIKNRKLALAKLKAILFKKQVDAQYDEIKSTKKNQVKTRNRNEKIRTYNFSQDRITDHRLGINIHNLRVFLEGGEPLEELIQKLDEHYLIENLLHIVDSKS